MSLVATLIFVVLISILLRITRDRGIKRSAALLLAFAWLWFASSRNPTGWMQFHEGSRGSASSAYDEGSAFDRNIYIMLMVMGVMVLISRSKRVVAFLGANLPVVLFFVYCGLSVAWSSYFDISIKRWFRGLGDLVMVMVILTDRDWAGAFKWVYSRLACLLVPLSILLFRWFPAIGRSYSVHDGHVSITGVTDDKNLLGAICTLFSLTAIWCILDAREKKGPRKKGLLIGYGAVAIVAIYLISRADSATATACMIEGAGVLILTSMPKIYKRPARVHLIAFTVLGFSALNLFAGSALLQMLGRNSTLTGRTELWSLCLTLVHNPLFGAGYESFWLGWRLERMWAYISGVNQAHNGYLEIYLNLGWIGVAFLVALLVSGYRRIISAVRRHEPAASLRLAFFVVACIANCTEAGFKMMHPMWIAILLVTTAQPALSRVRQRLTDGQAAVPESIESPDLSNALASNSI
jgi:O-antigen ligase